jgi:hypothetical protein
MKSGLKNLNSHSTKHARLFQFLTPQNGDWKNQKAPN